MSTYVREEVIATNATEEVLYSLSETARMFGVSERTLHRWMREGQLPVYRLGRQLRFRKSDIEAFLEERREVPLVQTPLPEFDQERRAREAIDELCTRTEVHLNS